MRRARVLAAWILWGSLVVGAIGWLAASGSAEPRTLGERVSAIAETLRCPVCRDLSVADSPSEIARQMRSSISSSLRAGQTADQIRAQFVRSYGQWILLSPPAKGLGLLVWLAPLAAMAFGGILIWRIVRVPARARREGDVVGSTLSADGRRVLEQALAGSLADEDA